MKTLYLFRHAKSSWSFDNLSDFSRPLGKRGRKDVVKMGDFVKKNIPRPDLIATSAASRAFYTALYMADAWNYPEDEMVVAEALYHADAHGLNYFLREADSFDTVALFGHNPGLNTFYNSLCAEFIENIPTCSLVAIRFEVSSWKEITEKTGKRLFFHAPKKI